MKILRKMWNNGKNDRNKMKDQLFIDLVNECHTIAPSARLSHRLRMRLERLPKSDRKEIVGRKVAGRSPLFLVCHSDNPEVVEFLISVCGAEVDQKGLFEVTTDKSVHLVSPLWCAAVAGKFSVVKCLVQHGADVNAVSDTGSTPVRSACFMTHFDIVSYLVENGADIDKANHNGGTCLINSVQSSELCKYLLKNGANPNAVDIQKKTSLHYAIQEHRFESTKLLLSNGSDPFLKSKYNDDALQIAAIKGACEIIEYLIEHVSYNKTRVAEAYELLGSTCLEDSFDVRKTVEYWKKAMIIRSQHNLAPKSIAATGAHYKYKTEFQTESDLNAAATDGNDMRMQSLLVCERILGNAHKETLYRIMQRGASYADSLKYDRCLKLWLYIFRLRVQSETLIFKETCFAAQAIVRLFCDMLDMRQDADGTVNVLFDDAFSAFELLCRHLPEAKRLVTIRPVHKKHQIYYDTSLGLVVQFIFILLQVQETEEQTNKLAALINYVVRIEPCTEIGSLSILHLAVVKSTILRDTYGVHDLDSTRMPSVDVVACLLKYGARVNSFAASSITPLYIASQRKNFDPKIVECLLKHGAHIDTVCTSDGERPLDLLRKTKEFGKKEVSYRTLACLCAEVIKEHHIPYLGQVPKTLETFVLEHSTSSPTRATRRQQSQLL